MMIDVVMNDLFIQSRSSRCCLAWGLIILKSQIADVYLLLWSLWMDTLWFICKRRRGTSTCNRLETLKPERCSLHIECRDIFDMYIRCPGKLWQGFWCCHLKNFNFQKSNFDQTITCDHIQDWQYLQRFFAHFHFFTTLWTSSWVNTTCRRPAG